MATGYRDPKSVRVSLGAFDAPSTLLDGVIDRDPRPWLRLSIGAAALAAVGSAVALRDVERFYGALTTSFTDQAIAQDLVNLFFVSPVMALLAWRGLRNSLASYLVWLGFLTFTVYNYAIYAFSIDFGPLFLLWVAVLGMASFSLIGGASAVVPTGVANALGNRKERFTGVFMLVVVALFAIMWLSDIVPALTDDSTPASVQDVGCPTQPGARPRPRVLPAGGGVRRLGAAAATPPRVRRCAGDAGVPGTHRAADPHHRVRRRPLRARRGVAAAGTDRRHHADQRDPHLGDGARPPAAPLTGRRQPTPV